MGFQKTVLMVALVILSITIIVLSIFISRKDDEKIWPPESSTCPPYYDISYNEDGTFCKDAFGIHDGSSTIDISAVVIQGATINNCEKFYVESTSGKKMNSDQKCSFVEKCKVNWEGWCGKPGYSY